DAFDAPARLAMTNAAAQTDHDAEVVALLSAEEFARVQSFARSQQVATNAVIEAAWALCLGRRSNHSDVSFGVAVAGRDANIAGIERMVGLTINNLPLRVKLNESTPVSDWLKSVHDAQSEQQQFAHVSLASIQQWSNVPWRTRLFETLLVFQHDDAEQRTSAWLGRGLTTELQHVPTRTAYPLSIMVAGTDSLEFRVTFDARYFNEQEAGALATALRDATVALATQTNATVGDVLSALPVLANALTHEVDASVPVVAPRTATESVLARIWSEVLGAEHIGVHDDFFRLGGYSLVATQIVSRIRSTLKTDAPVRLLFQHPTIATLATALAARDKKPGQLERIAQVVQRVQSMSLDEVRRASEARVVTN
ncbi:MAG: condensation domain-containing protein, partial [Gemmatimonadaceae bacterium]